MVWAKVKAGLLAGAVVAVPMICATLTVPHVAVRPAEIIAFNLFTNAPLRYRDGPFQYAISGEGAVDYRNKAWHYFARAEWFVPQVSGNLSTLGIAVSRWQPSGIDVWVARDAEGQPGEVLERFSNVLPPLITRGRRSFYTEPLILKSKTRPQLQAGSKYWLCLEPADPKTFVIWWPTWFPVTDDFLDTQEPGSWRVVPPGSQRPGLEGTSYRKWHTKGAFTVAVRVPKEETAQPQN